MNQSEEDISMDNLDLKDTDLFIISTIFKTKEICLMDGTFYVINKITGMNYEDYYNRITNMMDKGLLRHSASYIIPTSFGYSVYKRLNEFNDL